MEKQFVKINTLATEPEQYIVMEFYPEINYTLLRRNTKFQPYIAAYAYNEEENCWVNGHYFDTILEAERYISSKLRVMPYDRVAEIASRLMDMVKETDDIDEALREYDIELDDDEKKWFCILVDEEEEE